MAVPRWRAPSHTRAAFQGRAEPSSGVSCSQRSRQHSSESKACRWPLSRGVCAGIDVYPRHRRDWQQLRAAARSQAPSIENGRPMWASLGQPFALAVASAHTCLRFDEPVVEWLGAKSRRTCGCEHPACREAWDECPPRTVVATSAPCRARAVGQKLSEDTAAQR